VSKSSVLTCVTKSLVPTCVLLTCVSCAVSALSLVLPSSSDPMGLGKCGGDSGVTSESWVWRESMEDDGSRSGQGFWRDALSVRMVRQSRGL